MKKRIALLVFSAAALCRVCASEALTLIAQSEMWADEAVLRTVSKSLIRAAKDEKAVRAQLAGTNDSFFKTGLLFAPDDLRFGTFQGLPACYFRGVSLANFTKRQCRIIVVFTTEQTFTIHCFSPEGEEPPDAEKYIRIGGEPSKVTAEAFRFLEPKVKDGLPKMREMVQQLADAQGKMD